eukprot:214049_1
MSLPNRRYTGYLEKESLHLKKFRKRWIVLDGKYLCCYKTKAANNKKPTETIDLLLFRACYMADNKHEFMLQSKDAKIIRRFRCYSDLDLKKWILHIQQVIHGPIYTDYAKNTQNKSILIRINITNSYSKHSLKRYRGTFIITAVYEQNEKIKNIYKELIKYMKNKYYPINFTINGIKKESFTESTENPFNGFCAQTIGNTSITDYKLEDIVDKGLNVTVDAGYFEHKIISDSLTCSYLSKLNSNDP